MEDSTIEKINAVLSKSPLFRDIREEDFKTLLPCINYHTKKYTTGEYLFFAGDKINYIGIVISGALEISKENPAGSKHILDFLGPSQLFAEGIVCTIERLSPVTVRAKEDSLILFLPFERIIKSCSSACSFHFQLIKNMMLLLGEKNFMLNRKMELLMLKGMREKLATYLINESSRQNSLVFQIIPNRNELAEYLNVSRTAMCRELGRMKDLDILDYYQNSFKIISMEKLADCLETD